VTAEARGKLAQLAADWLRGGTLVVSDGATSASTPLVVAVDGATIVATGVFDETSANFHWLHRDVIAEDGTSVDRLEHDFGEKMLGAIWTLEVPLEVQ